MSSESAAPAEPLPMTGQALVVTALALALGTFMQVLDGTIANVSIPTIAGDMGVSASQGTWVITAFAVSNGISVPLTGWLMTRFGVVRTFVGSVILFTAMSFLCGVAWDLPSLVFFRVLQGAVSGPMVPGSQALLISVFGRNKQATALAIWSLTTLMAPICGPILGGYISDNFAWPWIFFINLPVGVVCGILCWRNLRARETPTRKVPIDRTGLGLLVVWVGALQVMLDAGNDADWFASPAIVVEAIVAAVAFVAWLIWELNEKNPIVDLSLFKSRNFTIGTLAFCLAFAVFFGTNLLMPLWLQTQMGYIATWAGLVLAPSGVVAVLMSPVMARLVGTMDARWTATLSLGLFVLSFLLRSRYGPDADFAELIFPMLFMGAGMSGFFISMVTIALNGVPPHLVPQASGLSNFARITAGSFAASITSTIWADQATLHQTRIAEVSGAPGDPRWAEALHAQQQNGATFAQATATLTQQVVHQAFFLATMDIFRMAAWLTLGLIPLIWLTARAVSQRGAAPVAAD